MMQSDPDWPRPVADESLGWREVPATPNGTRRWRPARGGPPLPARTERPSPVELRVFNDLHGHLLLPTGKRDRFHSWLPGWKAAGAARFCLGGGDDHVGVSRWDLWMDAAAGPDPAYALYASAGVDALVPGNHDLDWGLAHWLRKIGRHASLSAVWSNLAALPEAPANVAPAWVLERDGARLGVLGLLAEGADEEALERLEEVATIEAWDALLAPAVDAIVVLSHLGGNEREGPDGALHRSLPVPILLTGAHTHHEAPAVRGEAVRGRYLAAGVNGEVLGAARQVGAGGWELRLDAWPPAGTSPEDGAEVAWRREFARLPGAETAVRLWPAAFAQGPEAGWQWAARELAALPRDHFASAFAVERSIGLVGQGLFGDWPSAPVGTVDHLAWRGLLPFQDHIVETVVAVHTVLALATSRLETGWTAQPVPHADARCACGGVGGGVRLVTHEFAARGGGPYAELWRVAAIDPARLNWRRRDERVRDYLWGRLEAAPSSSSR